MARRQTKHEPYIGLKTGSVASTDYLPALPQAKKSGISPARYPLTPEEEFHANANATFAQLRRLNHFANIAFPLAFIVGVVSLISILIWASQACSHYSAC